MLTDKIYTIIYNGLATIGVNDIVSKGIDTVRCY